jgi:hypothetical protein
METGGAIGIFIATRPLQYPQVVCRFRPIKPEEQAGDPGIQWVDIQGGDVHIRNIGRDVDFQFDNVHGTTAQQIDIFNSVSHVIEGILDGYNGSLLAYGQVRQ